MEQIRAFISIAVPDTPILAEIREKLRRTSAVNVPDKVHMTLRFLGDVSEKKIKELSERMKDLEDHSSFGVSLKGIGAFPNSEGPRVIWIGAELGGPFFAIFRDIEKMLNDLSVEYDKKRFKAHVTLGRVRKRSDLIADIIEGYKDADAGSFRCSEIHLMGSVLTPEGAEHTIIRTAHLADNDGGGDGRK
ncbi:MAG: RNA 2',3'-cyclic phosphodiesterase [Methanomassiliicoccaceae archaeon]|nr:RNA 2',3'-cyclic phosphodiesterase [Methanomassiliicoccaceae archaeon]